MSFRSKLVTALGTVGVGLAYVAIIAVLFYPVLQAGGWLTA